MSLNYGQVWRELLKLIPASRFDLTVSTIHKPAGRHRDKAVDELEWSVFVSPRGDGQDTWTVEAANGQALLDSVRARLGVADKPEDIGAPEDALVERGTATAHSPSCARRRYERECNCGHVELLAKADRNA